MFLENLFSKFFLQRGTLKGLPRQIQICTNFKILSVLSVLICLVQKGA